MRLVSLQLPVVLLFTVVGKSRAYSCPVNSYWNGSECVIYQYTTGLQPDAYSSYSQQYVNCPYNTQYINGRSCQPTPYTSTGCPNGLGYFNGQCSRCPLGYNLINGQCQTSNVYCPEGYIYTAQGYCVLPGANYLPDLQTETNEPQLPPEIPTIELQTTTESVEIEQTTMNNIDVEVVPIPLELPVVQIKPKTITRPKVIVKQGTHQKVNNYNIVDSPTNVTSGNVNHVNVYVNANGKGCTTITRNNVTETIGCSREDPPVNTNGNENKEKCCQVVTPRQCNRVNETWQCKHRRYDRCGPFCTASVMYLRPRKVNHQPQVPFLPPIRPQDRPCNAQLGCADCSNGGFLCSSECGSCDYLDQQEFCQSYGGTGCSQEDGCLNC